MTIKRACVSPLTIALVCAAAGAATVASAAQAGGPAAHGARVATVQLRHTSLGAILVGSSGRTLYEFTRDRAGKNSCAAVAGCSQAWPPLPPGSHPTAGAGVKASLLSSVAVPGGGRQVTYAGHPLYLYSGDSGPGETSYVGVRQFGGAWYALNASGGAVR